MDRVDRAVSNPSDQTGTSRPKGVPRKDASAARSPEGQTVCAGSPYKEEDHRCRPTALPNRPSEFRIRALFPNIAPGGRLRSLHRDAEATYRHCAFPGTSFSGRPWNIPKKELKVRHAAFRNEDSVLVPERHTLFRMRGKTIFLRRSAQAETPDVRCAPEKD